MPPPTKNTLPRLFLIRHGDTDWTDSHQHTGRTDISLNASGEERARRLGARLQGEKFAQVFTSPLVRARRTCELAGFSAHAQVNADLVEWDYGAYEGRLTVDIQRARPDWNLFRDAARPGGESPPTGRGPRRSICGDGAAYGRRCRGLFQRAHHPHDRRPLAGPASVGRKIFLYRYRQRRHPGLRAQSLRAGNPLMERCPPAQRKWLKMLRRGIRLLNGLPAIPYNCAA